MVDRKPDDSGKRPLIFHGSDNQICKITLNCSLIEHVPGDCKNCNKKRLR